MKFAIEIAFLRRAVIFQDDKELVPDGTFLPGSMAAVWEKDGDVYFAMKDMAQLSPSVLVHETMHIVHQLFKIIGREPNNDDDEIDAYLAEYIFTKLDNALSNVKNGIPYYWQIKKLDKLYRNIPEKDRCELITATIHGDLGIYLKHEDVAKYITKIKK